MSMNEIERVDAEIARVTKEIQSSTEAEFFGDSWQKVKEARKEKRRELLKQLKQLKDEQRKANS